VYVSGRSAMIFASIPKIRRAKYEDYIQVQKTKYRYKYKHDYSFLPEERADDETATRRHNNTT
jgi:hypothetical protein